MFDTPIIDAHVHLWDPEHFPMPWLDTVPALHHAFDVETYREHTSNLPVVGMVYVEVGVAPAFALLEAQHVVEVARHDTHLRGIVAAAPTEYGERARPYLDALRELSPLIKGVRRNLQDEADASYCLRSDFMRGVTLLSEYDLSFDICVRHHQLPAVVELARRCPQVTFILDHLGKPDIRAGELDPWRSHLEELGACRNVWLKLSGLLTEADLSAWRLEEIRPYVTHALAVFGPQRAMFGGDWPVVLQAAPLRGWIEALGELIAHLPKEDREDVWYQNAQRCYRLGDVP